MGIRRNAPGEGERPGGKGPEPAMFYTLEMYVGIEWIEIRMEENEEVWIERTGDFRLAQEKKAEREREFPGMKLRLVRWTPEVME